MTDVRMSQNPLGASGPLVSQHALGTMTFGAETNEAEAGRQLDLYVERGGTFIDTADVYSGGKSEEIVGRWLSQMDGTGDLIIATKGRFAPPNGSRGASRRALVHACEASLNRIGVDAIDLYVVHGWDNHTPVVDTLATLSDLVRAGKIHNIGWSNIAGWQLERIVRTAEANGFPLPVSFQPQYSLLERGIELELLPCCLENGIAITTWSPLGGGWLTGKYRADARPSGNTRLGEDPDRGVEAYDIRNTDQTYAVLDMAETISKETGRPMSHIAMAWLLARPGVSSILLGARTAEQLADNLNAAGLVLDKKDQDRLTAASAIRLPAYPYKFLEDWSEMTLWSELGT